jgi:menaquinol-cytochrome c reductase iron-sulfur subunit
MPNPFEGETVTRRRVFEVAGQALGGMFGAAVALPVVGFAIAPIFDRPDEEWRGVGPVDDFTSKTYTQRVITLVGGIGEAGKTTVYIRRGSTQYGEDPNEFVAISTRCAHLGCPVRFVQSAGNFICPCHGGIYDFEGKVIGGPPVRPLDRFQTRVSDDGQLEIGPRYSVTSQLEPVRARDPGQFTGGIWEIIYPPRPTTAPPPN